MDQGVTQTKWSITQRKGSWLTRRKGWLANFVHSLLVILFTFSLPPFVFAWQSATPSEMTPSISPSLIFSLRLSGMFSSNNHIVLFWFTLFYFIFNHHVKLVSGFGNFKTSSSYRKRVPTRVKFSSKKELNQQFRFTKH